MPFISIIMVGYNAERYLPKALENVLAQSFKDFEIVFVNNGSQDSTAEIVEDFRQQHPEITCSVGNIIENKGLSNGRNMGLLMAKGNYVMFHDVDDWMDPDCLDTLARAASVSQADRIIQQVRYVNEDNEVIRHIIYAKDATKWIKYTLQGDLFRRSIIEAQEIKFALNAYFDDFYFANEFNSLSDSYLIIRETHYNMLIHSNSLTHRLAGRQGYFPPRVEATFEEMKDIKGRLTACSDVVLYEYTCILHYYNYVFQGATFSLTEKVREYQALLEIMNKYYPNYLKNKNIRFILPNGYYGHHKRNIWICSKAERIDKALRKPYCMIMLLALYQGALKLGAYKYTG